MVGVGQFPKFEDQAYAVQEGLDQETLGKLYLLRSEEHTSELQSLRHLVCRLLLEKKKKKTKIVNKAKTKKDNETDVKDVTLNLTSVKNALTSKLASCEGDIMR